MQYHVHGIFIDRDLGHTDVYAVDDIQDSGISGYTASSTDTTTCQYTASLWLVLTAVKAKMPAAECCCDGKVLHYGARPQRSLTLWYWLPVSPAWWHAGITGDLWECLPASSSAVIIPAALS